jgi:drug/metabolite transporter (DMT)-like permease
MLALGLSLTSAIAWGAADFLGGFSTKRLSVLTVGVVSQVAGLVAMALVVAVTWEPLPAGVVPVGLAAGVCNATGLAALYRGLSVGTMGVVAPTAALSGTVPIAVGLATGDRPSAIQLVGVALAAGGVVAAARSSDATRSPLRDPGAGVGFALVAALALGGAITLIDRGARSDPEWVSLFARVGTLSATAIAAAIVRPSFGLRKGELSRLAGIGVLDTGANLTFALAAGAGGLLTLNAVVASLYPVTTVLLARGVLGERLTSLQLGGVVVALAGVALIAGG